MVITQLVGGLGNQMFQYAAGKSLASQLKTQLNLDLTAFKKYKLHKYNLDQFNIASKTISPLKLPIINSFPSTTTYKEQQFHFDPTLFKQKGNITISGYWQSEKYFKNIDKDLKKDFQLKTKPRSKVVKLLKDIKSAESVAVHVRRGDYLKLKTKKVHGILSLDYYTKGIKQLSKKAKKPFFLFFSDDLKWVKANFQSKFPSVYLDGNHDQPGEDMWLMSQCKHQIIANSTFSWWGAWLNDNPTKTVIAPKKWFNQTGRNTKDLLPKDWIQV